MILFSKTIGLVILFVIVAVLFAVGVMYGVFQKKRNQSENGKAQLEKWYYYLPGTIFNVILGVIRKFIVVLLLFAFAWKSDRLWSICQAAIYLMVLVAGNVVIYLFFRKKEKFSAKTYWIVNLIAYFILSTVLFYILMI